MLSLPCRWMVQNAWENLYRMGMFPFGEYNKSGALKRAYGAFEKYDILVRLFCAWFVSCWG